METVLVGFLVHVPHGVGLAVEIHAVLLAVALAEVVFDGTFPGAPERGLVDFLGLFGIILLAGREEQREGEKQGQQEVLFHGQLR